MCIPFAVFNFNQRKLFGLVFLLIMLKINYFTHKISHLIIYFLFKYTYFLISLVLFIKCVDYNESRQLLMGAQPIVRVAGLGRCSVLWLDPWS